MKELQWQDAIIRDGFNQRGYVEEKERLHPAVSFVYRPMLPEEVEEFEEKRDNLKQGDAKRVRILLGKIVGEKIVSWSIKQDGNPVPVNELNARSLRPSLQIRLYNIIAGFSPSDIDPEWKEIDEDLLSLEELRGQTPEEQLGKS